MRGCDALDVKNRFSGVFNSVVIEPMDPNGHFIRDHVNWKSFKVMNFTIICV